MKNAFILAFILFLASCSIQKRQARHCLKCPEKIKIVDSTWYSEIERLKHVIVELEGETATSKVQFLPCPDGSMPQVRSTNTENGKNLSIRSRYDKTTGTLNTAAIQRHVKKDVYIPEKVIDKTAKRVEKVVKQADCNCRNKFIIYAIGLFALFALIWFIDKRRK